MSAGEQILKFMATPEGKAKIDKLIKEYLEKEDLNDKRMKEMMSNTNYFEWLNSFTKENEEFSDDDWLYHPEMLNDSDRENVGKLYLFYNGIGNYAVKNHIYPTLCNFGDFYKVKLDEVGFEIGVLYGQGTVYFCSRIPVDKKEDFIDFNDIMTNRKQENVEEIDKILETLTKTIYDAHRKGVPVEAIINTANSTIEKIMSSKDEKTKKLTK